MTEALRRSSHSSPSALGRLLGRVWRWWTNELSTLLPSGMRRVAGNFPKTVAIDATDPARPVFDGTAHAADRDALVQAGRRWRWIGAARIIVPIDRCLVRDVRIPGGALARVDDVLLLDLEQSTVFQRGDVVTGWRMAEPTAAGQSHVTVQQIVLKRSLVSQLMNDLAAAALPLSGIYVVARQDRASSVNLLPPDQRRGDRATALMRRLAAGAAVLVLLLGTSLYAMTVSHLQGAIEATRVEVKRSTIEAQSITRSLEQADAAAGHMRQLRQRKRQDHLVVAVWEELTRLLPATAWITDLKLESNAGQIDGLSGNAADLIAILTRSPILNSVSFASPVTRDPQRGVERFQIKFQVKRKAAMLDTAIEVKRL